MLRNLSIFTFTFLCFNLLAQLPEDYSLKHSIKQDGLSMQFTVLDPDKKPVSHHKTSKTYYWYKAQKVIFTQGGNSGQLLHGKFEALYGNKQLCEKGSFYKGLKDNEWNYWRTDGTMLRKEHWKKGKQRGKQYAYDTNGDLHKTTVIHWWGRSRAFTTDSIVDIRGKHTKVTVLDSLGRKVSVSRYRNTMLHGKQKTFTGEGNAVRYKKGVEIPAKEKKKRSEETTAEGAEKEKFFAKLKKRFAKKEGKQPEKKKASEKKEKTKPAKEPKPAREPKQKNKRDKE